MKAKNFWIIGAVILGILVLVLIFFPPKSTKDSGSTFSKAPEGYGAWFAYIQKQGFKIDRWQEPDTNFVKSKPKFPTTFLRVYPEPGYPVITEELEEWVKLGNKVVLVGIIMPATTAPFKSQIDTDRGKITIETTRRLSFDKQNLGGFHNKDIESILEDRSGIIAWEIAMGKGRISYITPSYFAANAYQDSLGNFNFLTDLVKAEKNPIVVDEYIHGYITKAAIAAEEKISNWVNYLLQTPLVILLIQITGLMFFLLWGKNKRFGNPIPIDPPPKNNNIDYINALAEVLFKAESHPFVIEKLAKAEQIQLQQKLGLGSSLLPINVLVESWKQQTKRPAKELVELFQQNRSVKSIDQLFTWLKQLSDLRKQVN